MGWVRYDDEVITMSELTDDQANNEHVARGAYYIPITSLEPGDPQ